MQEDFSEMDAQSLADLLRHHDQRIRTRAQLHLAGKQHALPLFAAAANQRLNELEQLHGVWGLGIMARRYGNKLAMEFLARLLQDPNPRIRGQAIKALGDTHLPNSLPLLSALLDRSPRVQALAALALSKHPHPEALDQLIPLIEENDDRDPYLRHAASLALAANAKPHDLASFKDHPSPSVRLAAIIALRRFHSPNIMQFLIDEDPRVSDEAIRAIHDLSIERARPALAALLDDYASPKSESRPLTRMIMRRLIHSAFRIGGEKNVGRLVKIAGNPKIHLDERLEALRLLGIWTQAPPTDHSLGKYAPLAKREVTDLKAHLLKYIRVLFKADSAVLGKTLSLASQYGLAIDTLDTGTLTRLVRDKEADALTRSEALKLLLKTSPEDPSVILTEAAQSSQDLLALTALELAAKRDPAANFAAVKGALVSDNWRRRQIAWTIIGDLPAEYAVPLIRDGLQQLKRGKGDPESMIELLEAARSRTEPAIDFYLTSYEQSLTLTKDDPLAKWYPSLAGGDPKEGEKLFKSHGAAQCMRCHRTESGHSEGGEAGPNLMGVALRHDARGLLQSLIFPNSKIAPNFGLAEISLKNGHTKSGVIIAETDDSLDFREGDQVWRANKDDLSSFPRQTSSMPSMEGILKPREARDIVAWLLTLTKESGETPRAYEAVTFDLDTPETKTNPINAMSETIDPAVMEAGKAAYATCTGCHQPEGQGLAPLFPPLAKSEWVNGPAENLIRIQLRGLKDPITVADKEYNGIMPAQAFQNDETIAAVLTYVRNSFGNSASVVTPDMVAALRGEVGKDMLTAKDLIQPTIEQSSGPLPEIPTLDAKAGLGASVWGLGATLVIGGLCAFAFLRMKITSK